MFIWILLRRVCSVHAFLLFFNLPASTKSVSSCISATVSSRWIVLECIIAAARVAVDSISGKTDPMLTPRTDYRTGQCPSYIVVVGPSAAKSPTQKMYIVRSFLRYFLHNMCVRFRLIEGQRRYESSWNCCWFNGKHKRGKWADKTGELIFVLKQIAMFL